MRGRRKYISENTVKSPLEFQRNNPDLDNEMIAVVTLWMFGGFSMREAFKTVYRPKCSPSSTAVRASLFYSQKDIKEIVRIIRYCHTINPYINPKALDWDC